MLHSQCIANWRAGEMPQRPRAEVCGQSLSRIHEAFADQEGNAAAGVQLGSDGDILGEARLGQLLAADSRRSSAGSEAATRERLRPP